MAGSFTRARQRNWRRTRSACGRWRALQRRAGRRERPKFFRNKFDLLLTQGLCGPHVASPKRATFRYCQNFLNPASALRPRLLARNRDKIAPLRVHTGPVAAIMGAASGGSSPIADSDSPTARPHGTEICPGLAVPPPTPPLPLPPPPHPPPPSP